jgi:hypothetical protein
MHKHTLMTSSVLQTIPSKDKLEQLQAVFQRISINTNAALLAQAVWKYSGYWINQGCKQLATRNTSGIRQMSEYELCCFGRMATYFQMMGMRKHAHSISNG